MLGNDAARGDALQDNELALMREDLRAAIDESGWKHEAVAAAMSEASGRRIDGAYLSKMLAGEKPIGERDICALPNEIESLYHRNRAERFGHLVVEQLDEDTATHHLASGLFNLLRSRLPARATRIAKASVRRRMVKATL